MDRVDTELTVRLAGSTFVGMFEYNGVPHMLFDMNGEDRVVRVEGKARCLSMGEADEVLTRRLSAVENGMVEMTTLRAVRRDPRVPAVVEAAPKTAATVASDMRRAVEVDELLSSRKRVSKTLGLEELETNEFMPGYVSDISRTDSEQQRIEVRDTRMASEVADIR